MSKNKESRVLNLEDFEFHSDKTIGIEGGSIYTLNGHRHMVKDMDLDSTVSELVGSRVARMIAGDSAPEVHLVKDSKGKVFAASKYIEDFVTLGDMVDSGVPESCFPHGCVIEQDGSIEHVNTYLLKRLNPGYKEEISLPNSEEVELAIKFLKHGDTHLSNRGVRIKDKMVLGAIIDFSRSLGGSDKVYLGENYNPEKMIIALEKLLAITPETLDKTLNDCFVELKECYPQRIAELENTRKKLEKSLSDRQKGFADLKVEVELEQNIIELIVARKNNNLEKYNQLLSIIKPKLENVRDEFKVILLENIPEDAKMLNIILDNPKRELKKAGSNNAPRKIKALSNLNEEEDLKSALVEAVLDGNAKIVDALIAAGVTTDDVDFGFNTPALVVATIKGHLEVVKVLVAAGEDVNEKYGRRRGTAIECLGDSYQPYDAHMRNELEIANVLIAAGAEISLKASENLLKMVVKTDDIKMFKTLLSHLNEESLSEHKEQIQEFKKRHSDQFINSASSQKNEEINQDDPLKTPGGVSTEKTRVLPDSFVDEVLQDTSFLKSVKDMESSLQGVFGNNRDSVNQQSIRQVDVENLAVNHPNLTSPIGKASDVIQGSNPKELSSPVDSSAKDLVQLNSENKGFKELSAADQVALGLVVKKLAKNLIPGVKPSKGSATRNANVHKRPISSRSK